MKFSINREYILSALQQIYLVSKYNTSIPIIGNILITVLRNKSMFITGTDLETEITKKIKLISDVEPGNTTVSTKKILDIVKSFPKESSINFFLKNEKLFILCKKSKFVLCTLPYKNFPNLNNWEKKLKIRISKNKLKKLIESTYFSIANQDIRQYLNGMLLEIKKNNIRSVSTNGHRLSKSKIFIDKNISDAYIFIIPRSGVFNLLRILNQESDFVELVIGEKHIRINIEKYILTTKLLEGEFPEYKAIFKKNSFNVNILIVDCFMLKNTLKRVSVISDKSKCINLNLKKNLLIINIKNFNQELAEEYLEAEYLGKEMEISCNSDYILDALNTIESKRVKIFVTNSYSAIILADEIYNYTSHIIMPMRL
ncbi:dnaN [Wigglesworthia glossinidia endosymbiont of Glossina brevipalpis]|uniref:Beta sliding clamp n=1 Tax=Wigglesworthia glossinidia brevipalpis TaxID=36870 RepID=Q8D3I6_WIGBR|nr:dnaN [Wigglesworthia glossinidia endosymbiont of Glossina brevipalpis]